MYIISRQRRNPPEYTFRKLQQKGIASVTELDEKQRHLFNTDDVANLDVLRAAAVLSVFIAHLLKFAGLSYGEREWHFGQWGVLAFFVHTSLVLMLSLERQGPLPKLISSFYLRRVFRLYPLSVVFVLISYVSPYINTGPLNIPPWTTKTLLANLSLTQNLFQQESMVGGLWTLPLEVQMYFALPFLFLFLRNRSWLWVAGFWLVSLLFGFVPLLVSDRLSILEYAPSFLGGVLAWKLSRRYQPIFPGWLWPIGLILVSLTWFSAINVRPYDLPVRWIFCVSLGAVIPMFRSMEISSVTRCAAILAKYSYGIYLSHVLAMVVGFWIFTEASRIIQWSVFLVLAIALPYLAFHLIEAPMITAGKKLTQWWQHQPILRRTKLAGIAP